METPDLDALLERLEDAREAGQELTVEEVCADCPEMLEALRARWAHLNRFDEHFGTRRETTKEVARKVSAMPENMAGKHLVMQADLQIQEFHDRGGLGDVYRAVDTELSREVAIKLLRADRQMPANLEDFRRESQIIGGLVHPGIVSIYGLGETIDGRPFYAMPFVDRGNLRAAVAEYHRNHPTRLVDTSKEFHDLLLRLVSVCKTIAYAHSRGIVHRDLKTENVLLGKYGETFVIDWGCATRVDRGEKFKVFAEQTLELKSLNDTTSTGGLTLRYASPEQLHGSKPVGPESDIYSLGAILFLLLTGESPLERTADEEVRKAVLKGGVPSPDTVKHGVSKRLTAICRKAMALEPHDRYDTAMQMADDIENFLADEPISVCRDSLGVRMLRVIKRNRTASMILMGTLVVAAALLFVAFAGQSYFAQRASDSARERLRMAATMTSDLAGFELNRRLTKLETEAAAETLVTAMLAIDADESDTWKPVQDRLYDFNGELKQAGITPESLFVVDAQGTQIARVEKSDSIGENFAYRSYFHGGAQDLDPQAADYVRPEPSDRPVISSAYMSTNKTDSGAQPIKISLSVPLFAQTATEERAVVGRLGMSIFVNDLNIFDRLKSLSVEAVLVETREYQWGTQSASGLVLDRIRGTKHDTFEVPMVSGEDADDVEASVKDGMPRVSAETLAQVSAMTKGLAQACIIDDLQDPTITGQETDAACAELSIPYRDLSTGWMVIFTEYDSSQNDAKP